MRLGQKLLVLIKKKKRVSVLNLPAYTDVNAVYVFKVLIVVVVIKKIL